MNPTYSIALYLLLWLCAFAVVRWRKQFSLIWNIALDLVAIALAFCYAIYDSLVTPKNNDHEDHY